MTNNSQNRFTNANVLITGANRGLGRALVHAALQASARRVYATARDVSKLDALVRQHPDRVVALELDVTNARSISVATERAPDVDILINNAGVLASYNLLTSTSEELALDFATNAFGVLEMTKAFLPALTRGQRGTLVNVLSIVSLASMPAIGGYSAAKAAAYSVTQALRADLAKRGVSVHAVLPGPVDTDMVRSMDMAKTSPDVVAKAIIDGVESGAEDIYPDAASRQMFDLFQTDPRSLAIQLAAG